VKSSLWIHSARRAAQPIEAVRLTPRPHCDDQRGAVRWQSGKSCPVVGPNASGIGKSVIAAVSGGAAGQRLAKDSVTG
jgi:hypothetical protein